MNLKFVFFLCCSFVLFQSCKQRAEEMQAKFEISQNQRRTIAQLIIMGDSIDPVLNDFRYDTFEDFDTDKYLKRINENKGRTTCGLAAALLVKSLERQGIEACTYNFGFNIHLSHVVALVKISDSPSKWIVQDAFFNCTIADSLNKPKDFFELLHDLKNQNLENIQIVEDTAYQEISIRKETENNWLQNMGGACIDTIAIDAILRKKNNNYMFQNCYSCMSNLVCDSLNFVKQFEKQLITKKMPPQFIYGFLFQINSLWGQNPPELQKKIGIILQQTNSSR